MLKKIKDSITSIKLNLLSKPAAATASSTYLGVSTLPLDRLFDSRPAFHLPGRPDEDTDDQWLQLSGTSGGSLRVRCYLLEVKQPIIDDRKLAVGPPTRRQSTASTSADEELQQPVDGGGGRMAGPQMYTDQYTNPAASFAASIYQPYQQQDEEGGSQPSTAPSSPGLIHQPSAAAAAVMPPADDSCISIGTRGNQLYDLTITISGVRGLVASLGRAIGPFWLSYKMFGVLVQTDAFPDTMAAEGPAIGLPPAFDPVQDTFTLRSCLPDLALFLAALPPVHVYLCAPGAALAVAELPLYRLLDAVPSAAMPVRKDVRPLGSIEPAVLGTGAIDAMVAADPALSVHNASQAAAAGAFPGALMDGGFVMARIGGEVAAAAQVHGGGIGMVLTASATLVARYEDGNAVGSAGEPMPYHLPASVPPSPPTPALSSRHTSAANSPAAADAAAAASASLDALKSMVAQLVQDGKLAGALAQQHQPLPPPQQQQQRQDSDDIAEEEAEDEEDESVDDAPQPAGLLAMKPLRVTIQGVTLAAGHHHHQPQQALSARFVYSASFIPPMEHTDADGGDDGDVSVQHQQHEAQELRQEAMVPSLPVILPPASTGDRPSAPLAHPTTLLLHVPSRFVSPSGHSQPVAVPGTVAIEIVSSSSPSSGAAAGAGEVGVGSSTVIATASIPASALALAASQQQHRNQQQQEEEGDGGSGSAGLGVLSVPLQGAGDAGDGNGATPLSGSIQLLVASAALVTSQQGPSPPPPSAADHAADANEATQASIDLDVPLAAPVPGTAAVDAGPVSLAPRPSLPGPDVYMSDPFTRRFKLWAQASSIRMRRAGQVVMVEGQLHLAGRYQDAVPPLAFATGPVVVCSAGIEIPIPPPSSSVSTDVFEVSGSDVSSAMGSGMLHVSLLRCPPDDGGGAATDTRDTADAREGEEAVVGTSSIPLESLVSLTPSLRCPVTHRSFDTDTAYTSHINALRASQRYPPELVHQAATSPIRIRRMVATARIPGSSSGGQGKAASKKAVAIITFTIQLEDHGLSPNQPEAVIREAKGKYKPEVQQQPQPQHTAIISPPAPVPAPAPAPASTAIVPAAPLPVPVATAAPAPAPPPPQPYPHPYQHQPQPTTVIVAAPAPAPAPAPPSMAELQLFSMDQLLALPGLRHHIEAANAAAMRKEEEALAQWRRAREDEWLAAKSRAESEWRREEQEREDARMAMMEASWADREAERQAVLVEAQERVKEVEGKLRKMLTTAEARLRDADRAKEDAARVAESKVADLNALQRRLREDSEHALSIARQREQTADRRVAEMSRELEAARHRCTQLEGEAVEARKAAASAPDVVLRDALQSSDAEITMLKQQVTDAKEEAQRERNAKDEARVQVLRLAKEIQRLRAEAAAHERLEQERLRVNWLSREERYVLDGDRSALREIRRQADQIRDKVAAASAPSEGQPPGGGDEHHDREDHPLNGGDAAAQAASVSDENVAPAHRGKAHSSLLVSASSASSPSSNSSTPLLPVSLHERSAAALAESVTPAPPASASAATATAAADRPGPPVTAEAAASVISHLKTERRALLSSSAGYTVSHPMIRRIDRALVEAEGAMKRLQRTADLQPSAVLQ